MFERLTKEARRVIIASIRTAADFGAAKAGPEHLLLGLAAEDQGAGARILIGHGVTGSALRAAMASRTRRGGLSDDEICALRAVGISANEVFRRIEEAFGPDALDEASASQQPKRRGRLGGPFDSPARKVIELSLREAIAMGHRQISSGHILLGLLRHGVSGPMSTVLTAHGVTHDKVRQDMLAESQRAS